MKLNLRNPVSAFLLGIALIALASAASQNVPPSIPGIDQIFDVRNGDQQGKLLLKNAELAFESLTDARHSRIWKYADIRELSRRKSEFSVKPFHGDKYSFQFKNKQQRDKVYDLISTRIVAARQGAK